MSPLYGLNIPLYYKKTPILHTQVIFTFMLYVYAQTAGSGSVLAVAEAACHWFCVTAPSSDWLCVGREEDCCTTNL